MTRVSLCETVLVVLAYGNAVVWLFLVGLIQVERVILNVGSTISWARLWTAYIRGHWGKDKQVSEWTWIQIHFSLLLMVDVLWLVALPLCCCDSHSMVDCSLNWWTCRTSHTTSGACQFLMICCALKLFKIRTIEKESLCFPGKKTKYRAVSQNQMPIAPNCHTLLLIIKCKISGSLWGVFLLRGSRQGFLRRIWDVISQCPVINCVSHWDKEFQIAEKVSFMDVYIDVSGRNQHLNVKT